VQGLCTLSDPSLQPALSESLGPVATLPTDPRMKMSKKDKKFKLHFLMGFLLRRRSLLPGWLIAGMPKFASSTLNTHHPCQSRDLLAMAITVDRKKVEFRGVDRSVELRHHSRQVSTTYDTSAGLMPSFFMREISVVCLSPRGPPLLSGHRPACRYLEAHAQSVRAQTRQTRRIH
jgi:hypothetical protein